jgi:hypothetical protein
MKRMRSSVFVGVFVLLAAIGTAAVAADVQDSSGDTVNDVTQNDDFLVNGHQCISDSSECVDGEGWTVGNIGNVELKLEDNVPALAFTDPNVMGGDFILATDGARFAITQTDTGSALFEIAAGAPSQSLVVTADGSIGAGTTAPDAAFELFRSDGTARLVVDEDSGVIDKRVQFWLQNQGQPAFRLTNTATASGWELGLNANDFFQVNAIGSPARFLVKDGGFLSRNPAGNDALNLTADGNLSILGTLTQNSDRNAKSNIVGVDPNEVLNRLRSVPIAEWSYSFEDVRHVGPMAQDFYSAFELGAGETGISTMDTSGVALASIQALASQNDELRAQNEALMSRVEDIEAALGSKGGFGSTPWLLVIGAATLAFGTGALASRRRRAEVLAG